MYPLKFRGPIILPAVAAFLTLGSAAHAQLFVSSFSGSGGVSEYTFSGTFVRTFVAAGSGGLNTPSAIAFGPDGNLYVASAGTASVKKYDGTTGAYISDVATGISQDYGIRFGPDGSLYVTSDSAGSITRVNPATGAVIQTFASVQSRPQDVFVLNNGDLIAPSGSGSNPVLVNHITGTTSPFATGVGISVGMTQGADNRFYFSDYSGGGVTVVPATGGAAASFTTGGSLSHPQYLAFANNSLYVGSISNSTVQYFNASTGAFQGSFASSSATGIAVRGATATPEPGVFALAACALPLLVTTRRRRSVTQQKESL